MGSLGRVGGKGTRKPDPGFKTAVKIKSNPFPQILYVVNGSCLSTSHWIYVQEDLGGGGGWMGGNQPPHTTDPSAPLKGLI